MRTRTDMRDSSARLQDILDAIAAIERYADRGRSAFEDDELIQIWIVHHLQIIGEAAGRLGSDFRLQYPQLPWPAIVAMRNVLVHDYFGTDLDEGHPFDTGAVRDRVSFVMRGRLVSPAIE